MVFKSYELNDSIKVESMTGSIYDRIKDISRDFIISFWPQRPTVTLSQTLTQIVTLTLTLPWQ